MNDLTAHTRDGAMDILIKDEKEISEKLISDSKRMKLIKMLFIAL